MALKHSTKRAALSVCCDEHRSTNDVLISMGRVMATMTLSSSSLFVQ
jgi:hypothetical protein